MFTDRTEAGERLADALVSRGVTADLVLAIPRGGLPVARAVADRLDAPLDIVVAKKLGMPGNPEFAIGAVASDGSVWLDEETVERYDVSDDYLTRERERATAVATDKLESYRGTNERPDVSGKRVIVVDDGVATGATARACLRHVRNAGAARVVLAVPVGPLDALADLETEADAVIAVETPTQFGAVGAFYRSFAQVSDAEAIEYLGRGSQPD